MPRLLAGRAAWAAETPVMPVSSAQQELKHPPGISSSSWVVGFPPQWLLLSTKKGQCWLQPTSVQSCPAYGLTSLVLCFLQTNSSASAVGHVLTLSRPGESCCFSLFPQFSPFSGCSLKMSADGLTRLSLRHLLPLAPSQGHRETIAALWVAMSCSVHPGHYLHHVGRVTAISWVGGGVGIGRKHTTPEHPKYPTFIFLVYGAGPFRLTGGSGKQVMVKPERPLLKSQFELS